MVSFPEVGADIVSVPGTIANEPQRVLFVGQQTAAATATSGELQTEIGNNGEERTLYGVNSQLAAMIRAAKIINKVTRFDAIGLDDNGAGAASTGTITFAGTTASESGTLIITIGSDENHSLSIDITLGDTPTVAGDTLVTAITADEKIPVTAANVSGVVTLTAIHKGTTGDTIGIRSVGSVAGITVAIAAMTGGATNPVLTTLFDPIANERYQTIIYPAEWGVSTLTDFLDPRFNVDNLILDGVGIVSTTDTFANLGTVGDGLNSRNLYYHGNKLTSETLYKGSALFELDYVIAAEFGAVRALRLTEGASISRHVTVGANARRDNFGGVHMASLPYANTPFYNLPMIDTDKIWTEGSGNEVDNLLDKGISVLGNNKAGVLVLSDQAATTYKTNIPGDPDITFKFLNYVDTSSGIREYFFNNLKSEYAQSRLSGGDPVPDHKIATEGRLRAFAISLYDNLSGPGFVLTQAGADALEFFKNNLVVEIVLETGKVNFAMSVPIVTQVRQIIGTIAIGFSVNK